MKQVLHIQTKIKKTKQKLTGAIAFIRNKEKFLIGYECKDSPSKNKWRLLGGKVEEGETPEEILHRELQEEAKISINIVKELCIVPGNHRPIDIHVFLAEYKSGTPTPNMSENNRLEWFTVEKIKHLETDELTRKLFEKYCREI